MALQIEHFAQRQYAHQRKTDVKQGHGPWGAAIRYWLAHLNMNQAALARQSGLEEKTISTMVRGFHTSTRKLEEVANALGVPLEQILVPPDRQKELEDEKRAIQIAVELALMKVRQAGREQESTDATLKAAERQMVHEAAEKEKRDAKAEAVKPAEKPAKNRRPVSRFKKPNHQK